MKREQTTHKSELYFKTSSFNNMSFTIALWLSDQFSVYKWILRVLTKEYLIFYSQDYTPLNSQWRTTDLRNFTKGLLLERGVSHSQIALAINYRSVWFLRQGSTSRSWYFLVPKHYLIQWHISIVNSKYSHLKYNSSWTSSLRGVSL